MATAFIYSLFFFFGCLHSIFSLDNGLALTPPMGWLAWERFRCVTDCTTYPDSCISENLFLQIADSMVSDGFLAAGYEYVNIDDCYLASTRDSKGNLIPDPVRFPHGLRWLGDQLHSKGLKFGVYEDYGNTTCGGYPGLVGHIANDVKTFINWTADSLKVDSCYMDPNLMDRGFTEIGSCLNQSKRPILYSCSAPYYERVSGLDVHWELYIRICNLWRIFDDIEDSWDSVSKIIDFWAQNQDELVPIAGPGHWNDPDMLIIGDFSLSYTESKSQFAMWAMFAAPLYLSVDLRKYPDWAREIVLNKEIIAVDQDPLGMQARRVYNDPVWGLQVWTRLLVDGQAVALHNHWDYGQPLPISANWTQLGIPSTQLCSVRDLYQHKDMGKFQGIYTDNVPPHGVVMLKLVCV